MGNKSTNVMSVWGKTSYPSGGQPPATLLSGDTIG